jgi:non-heme chloroperoxidase
MSTKNVKAANGRKASAEDSSRSRKRPAAQKAEKEEAGAAKKGRQSPEQKGRYFTTNDGVRLKYTDSGGSGKVVVFIHGWTASGRYFDKSVGPLVNAGLRVVTYDHRGMGGSANPGHGSRVCRLSADLRCLVDHLDLKDATFCGASLGLTVIALYVELFGLHRLKAACFVDQPPAQFIKPGWELGSVGGSSREMVQGLKAALKYDPEGIAKGITDAGFGEIGPTETEYSFFKAQIAQSDLEFCGRLMEVTKLCHSTYVLVRFSCRHQAIR